MALQSLKDKALKLNSQGGVPFMEGRAKAESLPVNTPVTIDDYGFIDGEDGEYVVISLKEDHRFFYFGGGVVTDKMVELDKELSDEEKKEVRSSGLPVMFNKKKNKAGKREYMSCEFFPEV